MGKEKVKKKEKDNRKEKFEVRIRYRKCLRRTKRKRIIFSKIIKCRLLVQNSIIRKYFSLIEFSGDRLCLFHW